MPACALPASIPCSTPTVFNAGRMLASLVAPLLPGTMPVTVCNRFARPGQGRAREMRALLDGASSQMIGWGTATGFKHLIALAEQVAPGISVPFTAYQAYCALTDASRYNLIRCLQTLPLAALVPAQLQAVLAPVLGSCLPGPGAIQWQDHLVIGIACCAVLYELGRTAPVEVPHSPVGRALLRCLAQLRALSNIVAGLQQVANAAPRGLLPLPGTVAGCGGAAPPRASAWPLPGALARSGKGGVAPPKVRPAAPPRQSSRARLTVNMSPRRQLPQPRPGKGVVAGVGASAAGGDGSGIAGGFGASGAGAGSGGGGGGGSAGESNKEVLFPVMQAKKPDSKAKSPTDSDKSSEAARGRPATSTHHTAPRPPADSAAEQRAPQPPGVAVATITVQSLLPSCLKFQITEEAIRQVRKARFDRAPTWFCVRDRARPLFNRLFDTADEPRSHGVSWMVALPVHERPAPALREAPIRKYAGLGQLHRNAPHTASALGEDALYTVATLSYLGDHALRRHHVSSSQVLLPGCFKLVSHLQLDGRTRWLMAYAIPHRGGGAGGVRAGFMRITPGPEGFTLQDDESGLAFSSKSLDELASGIERVSGWRHQHEAVSLPWADPPHVDGDAPGNPLSLFLRHPHGVAAAGGAHALPFDRNLQFFEPIHFGRGRRLLRTCFTATDHMIVLVDARGTLRTLVFGREATDGDRRVLNAQRPEGRAFVHDLGLEPGLSYAVQDVIGTLEHNGYTRMPDAPDEDAAAGPGPQAGAYPMRILADSRRSRPPLVLEAGESGEIIAPPILSSFHLMGHRIDYVDHDGSMGTLVLEPQGTSPQRFHLAAGITAEAREFARINGLLAQDGHTLIELQTLLYEQGFVQITESEGGRW